MTVREAILRRYQLDCLTAFPYVLVVHVIALGPLISILSLYGSACTDHLFFFPSIIWAPLSAGALLWVGIQHHRQGCRCPWCLGSLVMVVVGIRAGRVNYCPSCGKSLDEKKPISAKPAKKPSWADELA